MTIQKKKTQPASTETTGTSETSITAGTASQSTTKTPPPILVADIKTMVAIINTASQRGSFQANELTQVGQLHDKLVMFLQFLEENQPKENPPEGA